MFSFQGGWIRNDRRLRVIADSIASRLPQNARVLDVGCGDGRIAALLLERRPDLQFTGIDVHRWPDCDNEVVIYDGETIPFPDKSFDAAICVDVLHHTDDPQKVLREIKRVAAAIVLKDHTQDGFFAYETLRFLDFFGNKEFGVRLPYNYFSKEKWETVFAEEELKPSQWDSGLGIYAWPLSLLFDRSLHFVAVLETQNTAMAD